jgi:hypothetical protein
MERRLACGAFAEDNAPPRARDAPAAKKLTWISSFLAVPDCCEIC